MTKTSIHLAVAFACSAFHHTSFASDTTNDKYDDKKLEEIFVIANPSGGNTPTFDEQFERFLRRPGAETVVSTEQLDNSHLGTLDNLLSETPGVYSIARGNQNSGLYSIRGTDIATDGPRNGRGIRAYIDGVPLGRTEAGLTVSLIDVLAADYVEVYRGANSLRFGAISAGGALNFVSRTGKNNPGTKISAEVGAFDYQQYQLQHGGESASTDYYASLSTIQSEGYREQTETDVVRLTSNIGLALSDAIDTRFFFTLGKDHQEQASTIPLNLIEENGRDASFGNTRNVDFDTDRNFDYVRLANRTDWTLEQNGKIAFDSFVLRTEFDHLPTPFSGLVDNTWEEFGIGTRYDLVTQIAGMTTEFTAGIRGSYTDGEFLRFQHLNGGQNQGDKVNDTGFESLLVEAYGEAALSLSDSLRLFLGAQVVDISRELHDNFRENVTRLGPFGPPAFDSQGNQLERPQPGSDTDDDGYDVDFDTINPKLGINWQYHDDYFFFASIARSYEVPTGSDVSNVVSNGAGENGIVPQEAWTYEIGTRGGNDTFFVDLTLYRSEVSDEILSRSCDENLGDDLSVCSETIAFNAGDTIHQGIELGMRYGLGESLIYEGDSSALSATWNYSDFNFDNDPIFGNNRLPVIPEHTLFLSWEYTLANGFYAEADFRYASERGATYDGSGGEGFTLPSYETYGLLLGYKPEGKPYSFFVQGTNLTDEIYASTFTAEPTQPISGFGPNRAPQEFVGVRVANGRAWYAGFTYAF